MRHATLLVCALVGTLPVLGASTTVRPGNSETIVVSGNQPPEHPVTPDQVRQILELARAENLQQEMVDSMLPSMQQMMPYMPESVLEDFRKSLRKADFEAAMIRSYQQHMSKEDAAQIIAFYRSPAGQHMIAIMPQIMSEGQDAGAALGQRIMLQVIQRHKAEIDAAATRYHAEHAGEAAPQR